MSTSSIGQFLAALRKASGMTQQDVADRLNVSNKAVSRWERDECAPDITLLPALAEMFGVTCDELIKGERILTEEKQEKSEPKIEKQVRAMLSRTLSKFKTRIYVSFALSVAGLLSMFGIGYGFFRPVIGFVVLMLFAAAAVTVAAAAMNLARTAKDSELFADADPALTAPYCKTAGSLGFYALFAALSAVVLALPIILTTDDPYAIIWFSDYAKEFLPVCLLALVVLYLLLKNVCARALMGVQAPADALSREKRRLTLLQGGFAAAGTAMWLIAPYLDKNADATSPWTNLLKLAGIVMFACCLLCLPVFLQRHKDHAKALLPTGIRGVLLLAPAVLAGTAHSVAFVSRAGAPVTIEHIWEPTVLVTALAALLAVLIVSELAETIINKKAQKVTPPRKE